MRCRTSKSSMHTELLANAIAACIVVALIGLAVAGGFCLAWILILAALKFFVWGWAVFALIGALCVLSGIVAWAVERVTQWIKEKT